MLVGSSMIDRLKNNLLNDKKIAVLLTVLFIFNILLFINLFGYMTITKHVNISILHEVGTIISAIIILGFISTRLPRFKKITDGSIYEIAYLVIIGLLSITVSYFNKSANGESLWAPFLEMFRMLSVILILTFIATKSKSFKAIVRGDISRKAIIWQFIIFAVLGILSSYFTLNVNGIPGNARSLVVMIAALFGGPYVGVPVGLISGVWRYFMGGPTALPCAVATILCGIIGGLIYKWSNGRFLNPFNGALLMLLYSGFDMFIISVLSSGGQGLIIANALYAPMTFTAVLGIILFSMFLIEKKEEASTELEKEIRENTQNISTNNDIIDVHTDKIIELSQELEEYKNKTLRLEKELQEIKNDKK